MRAVSAAFAVAALVVAAPARAQTEPCRRAVVFTLPGVTWADVERVRSPELLGAAARGATGSMSVRTNTPRTSYASGFASIGGGARLDGVLAAGGWANRDVGAGEEGGGPSPAPNVRVAGLDRMRELADEAGYGAVPGALGSAVAQGADARSLIAIGNADLGLHPPLPGGLGRWTMVAAMNAAGVVDTVFGDTDLLIEDPRSPFGVRTDPGAIRAAVDAALEQGCSSLVVDQGDLIRADALAQQSFRPLEADRDRALQAADDLLGHIRDRLDPERDLLLVVSPTSPAWAPVARLGVAVAAGPGFEPGALLESASTRRRGVVTLPDVAPTVLSHLGVDRPATMNGRTMRAVESPDADRIGTAIELDAESVFVDRLKSPISTWFVAMQVIVYLAVLALVMARERSGAATGSGLARALETAALALVAFPIATFFGGIVVAHELGEGPFLALLLVTDVAVVAGAFALARTPLDRLLVISAFTLAVMIADLVTGARLQLNTVFGYSPIVAGRFAGAGNIAFAILGASTVLTGTLLVHRYRSRAVLWGVAALFAVVVVIDGAPAFGSDVGGVIALVPALALTWFLLSGVRPDLRLILWIGAGMVLALAAFTALDLARPDDQRTHLARLAADVADRGPEVLWDTIERKIQANLRVFRSTVWTLFVPPALVVLGWLLTRPRGRWARLAERYPKLRAGLFGGLVVAVLGFAVNDSGIVVPAVVLGFLVPMALLVHLKMEMETGP